MAFVLNGVISQNEIRNLFIPILERSLVGRNFVNVETVMDAESIKIAGINDVAVLDYTGSAVTTDATDKSVTLTLDQAKYFQKAIDKVDNAQSAVKIIGKVLESGARATAEAIDDFIFAKLATTPNTIPTVALDETNVLDMITDLGTALTNLKAPRMGRVLGVSPEISALIARANYGFQTTSAEESTRTGYVGVFGGFTIYETLGLADGAGGKEVIACVPDNGVLGIGYQEYNIGEPVEGFKWIAKGLANYGAVIQQSAYVVKGDMTIA